MTASCSVAIGTFFEREAQPLHPPPHRRWTQRDASGSHPPRAVLGERRIRLGADLGDQVGFLGRGIARGRPDDHLGVTCPVVRCCMRQRNRLDTLTSRRRVTSVAAMLTPRHAATAHGGRRGTHGACPTSVIICPDVNHFVIDSNNDEYETSSLLTPA